MAKKEKYKYINHTWYFDKHAGKWVCAECGLVRLNNKATEWCVKKGCLYKDHDDYRSSMKRLTKQFNF